MREKQIEKRLVRRVEELGGTAYKFVSPGHRAVPDRLIVLSGGRIAFIECKAPGEKPSGEQYREIDRLTALGAKVFVVSSYEEVEAILHQD
jgi:Holliday junction resolvase